MSRLKQTFFIVCAALLSCQSQLKYVPDSLLGKWKSDTCKIQVRDRDPNQSKFRFTSNIIGIQLHFERPNKISGLIGTAPFETKTIYQNQGLPHSVSGISYIISCGQVSKLFENDPLESKFLELWLIPQTHPDTLRAELRCKHFMDAFPMGSFTFIKKSNYVH